MTAFIKTETKYGREEKTFDLATFGEAVAAALGISCEVREPGSYPVVTLTHGDARIHLRNGYGAKFGKVEFAAWFAAETFLEHHERSKLDSVTVDGSRPVDAIAKDLRRRLIAPIDAAASGSERRVAAKRNRVDGLKTLAADLRAAYPGLSVEMRDSNSTTAKLYFNNNGCYFTGEVYEGGRITIERLSLNSAAGGRALLDLIASDCNAEAQS